MEKIILLVLALSSGISIAQEQYDEVCEAETTNSPRASWDFNAGESPSIYNDFVKWHGDHGGIVKIPETKLQGLKFRFKGKGPKGDSTSEFRYDIKEPSSHLWEYLSFYQPDNFYHRLIVEISPKNSLVSEDWNEGDKVVTERGNTAKVDSIIDGKLFIKAPEGIYDIHWGKGRTIKNLESGATFESTDSKFYASNNKLSAMWQGKYSNAAIIVSTVSRSSDKGGEEGVGYCDTVGSRSSSHGPFQVKRSSIGKNHVPCFDPINNAQRVDLIIERKRSDNPDSPNGILAIWKRSENSGWIQIFRNESVPAYQASKNYFDKGYVLGWSNSGFKEDTVFYLLKWQLWDKKPSFL